MKKLLLFCLICTGLLSVDAQSQKLKIGGWIQTQYQADIQDEGLTTSSFRIRRARLVASGNLTDWLSYKVQGDFGNSPMLVDAYVKIKCCDAFSLQVGQYKLPFSMESPIAPLDLEACDYSDVITKMVGYSDVCGVGKLGRDIGVMASGKLFEVGDEKPFHIVEYSLGIFNGNGPNGLDNNKQKDIVGRLDIHPMLEPLTLSASFYSGTYNDGRTRDRMGLGLQWKDERLVVRGEYIWAQTGVDGDSIVPVFDLFTDGYYAVAGYWFRFQCRNLEQRLMPFLRYDAFHKGSTPSPVGDNSSDEKVCSLGLQYWPCASLQFRASYSLIRQQVGSKENDASDDTHRIMLMLNYKF